MNSYEVQETAVIDAPADVIYGIFSNYREGEGHHTVLPKKYFKEMVLTEGGQGAGTKVTVHMQAMGVKVVYHLVVTEPEPGRVLQEEDDAMGVVTRFIMDPIGDGQKTRVTLHTVTRTKPGFQGFMEKLINPPFMHKIYRQELGLLAEVVKQQTTSAVAAAAQ